VSRYRTPPARVQGFDQGRRPDRQGGASASRRSSSACRRSVRAACGTGRASAPLQSLRKASAACDSRRVITRLGRRSDWPTSSIIESEVSAGAGRNSRFLGAARRVQPSRPGGVTGATKRATPTPADATPAPGCDGPSDPPGGPGRDPTGGLGRSAGQPCPDGRLRKPVSTPRPEAPPRRRRPWSGCQPATRRAPSRHPWSRC